MAEKLIISNDRKVKYGEVFTPIKIVNDMLNMLEKANKEIFNPGKTFLEPAFGTMKKTGQLFLRIKSKTSGFIHKVC